MPFDDFDNEAAAHDAQGKRPTITVAPGKLDVLATECEDAILKSGAAVFQRGWRLVRPIEQEIPAAKGRTTMATALRGITTPCMLDGDVPFAVEIAEAGAAVLRG